MRPCCQPPQRKWQNAPAEDLANQARYLDQLDDMAASFIDEIRYRRAIRLPARGTDGIFAYHNAGG